jgi:hypothetical protein
MFEGVLLGLGIGMLRGGRARGIIKIDFNAIWLLLISVSIEFALSTWPGTAIAKMGISARIFFVTLQYCCFLAFIAFNIRKNSIWIIGLGGLLNMIVMIVNGGRMPVDPFILKLAPNSIETIRLAAGEICNYMIADETVKLLFLSDIIQIWNFTRSIVSVGDLIIAVGMFFLVQNIVLSAKPAQDKKQIVQDKKQTLQDKSVKILYKKGQW